MKRISSVSLLLIFSVLMSFGCNSPTQARTQTPVPTDTTQPTPTSIYCDVQEITDYFNLIKKVYDKFNDRFQIALSTSKTALAEPVAMLKESIWDFENISPGRCTEIFHNYVLHSMNKFSDGFDAVISNEVDSVSNALFAEGTEYTNRANEERDRLTNCGSNCLP